MQVMANDHNAYSHVLASCYVQADREEVLEEAASLVEEFNQLPGKGGWFTETYCRKSRYFHPDNGVRIEAIRNEIVARCLPGDLEAVMLTSLMEAADRVDSTVGVQMAYLKTWAPRARKPLELRVPDLAHESPHGPCRVTCLDACDAAACLEADLAYVDPPYNQHSYLGNYHVWETLVRWDVPEVYGVACKRVDCRTRKSAFNRRHEAAPALAAFLDAVQSAWLIVSYSSEGFIAPGEMEEMLSKRGTVHVIERANPRYVGARIGIHNQSGEKVGTVGDLENTEYLFIVHPQNRTWKPPTGILPRQESLQNQTSGPR